MFCLPCSHHPAGDPGWDLRVWDPVLDDLDRLRPPHPDGSSHLCANLLQASAHVSLRGKGSFNLSESEREFVSLISCHYSMLNANIELVFSMNPSRRNVVFSFVLTQHKRQFAFKTLMKLQKIRSVGGALPWIHHCQYHGTLGTLRVFQLFYC